MSNELYDPGSKIRLSVRFVVAGVLSDPTTVSLKVKDPAGAVTTYTYAGATIIKDAVGEYHKDLVPATPGRWFYKFLGTGNVEATTEESFRVREQVIA